jgi:hypothetical protein
MEPKSEIYTYGVKHYGTTKPTADHIAGLLPPFCHKYLLSRVLLESLNIKEVRYTKL